MFQEPDWESLNDLNFLLYSRMAEPLNAALSALEISEEDELNDHSAQWWRDRAKSQISTALALVMAWSWLIQHKNGMAIPKQAIRPFTLQSLLDWLGDSFKIDTKSVPLDNEFLILQANQETFQEALLLLHNVATSQGSATKVEWDKKDSGIEFVVSFKRSREKKEILSGLDSLLLSFKSHWRSQLTAFELHLAQSFLELNSSDLIFEDNHGRGEFRFAIKQAQNVIPSNLKIALTPAIKILPKLDSSSLDEAKKKLVPPPENMELSQNNSTIILPEHETQTSADLRNVIEVSEIVSSSTPTQQEKRTGSWDIQPNTPPPLHPSGKETDSPEWKAVMGYEEIDWDTMGFVGQHSYQRMTNPLIKAMGHLDAARYADDDSLIRDRSLNNAHRHLEMMVTLMKSWTALTRWKQTGKVDFDRHPLKPNEFPEWFVDVIRQRVSLEEKHTRLINAHNDTFFEGMLLLVDVANAIGTLQQIISQDGSMGKRRGVWFRIVFRPPDGRQFKSKLDILDSFIRTNPLGDDMAVQFSVADDLLTMNKMYFSLQENIQTHEQAFAIFAPAFDQEEPKQTVAEKTAKKLTFSAGEQTIRLSDNESEEKKTKEMAKTGTLNGPSEPTESNGVEPKLKNE